MLQAGKELNKDQQEALGHKDEVARLIKEFEDIRTVFNGYDSEVPEISFPPSESCPGSSSCFNSRRRRR